MAYETAGDPMTELKWTRKTTEKIAGELKKLAIDVCAKTVGRLLKELKYSLTDLLQLFRRDPFISRT